MSGPFAFGDDQPWRCPFCGSDGWREVAFDAYACWDCGAHATTGEPAIVLGGMGSATIGFSPRVQSPGPPGLSDDLPYKVDEPGARDPTIPKPFR